MVILLTDIYFHFWGKVYSCSVVRMTSNSLNCNYDNFSEAVVSKCIYFDNLHIPLFHYCLSGLFSQFNCTGSIFFLPPALFHLTVMIHETINIACHSKNLITILCNHQVLCALCADTVTHLKLIFALTKSPCCFQKL